MDGTKWVRIVGVHWPDDDEESDEADDGDVEYFVQAAFHGGGAQKSVGCGLGGAPPPPAGLFAHYFNPFTLTQGSLDEVTQIRRWPPTGPAIGKTGVMVGTPSFHASEDVGPWAYTGEQVLASSLGGVVAVARVEVQAVTDSPTCYTPPGSGLSFQHVTGGGSVAVIERSANWSGCSFTSDDDPPRVYTPVRLEATDVPNSYYVIFKRSS